ncbi:hypothetical protein AURDEDRAFT_183572 [Auricularia subglabra TFB-10046 SS5]|nr:hypothetical protein AURDEDRAFT_183572 [Auricularia subglabra TFB-10046 SS5]
MSKKGETIDKVLAGAETVLGLASEGLAGVDVPGVEGIISGALAIIRLIQSSRDNSAACVAAAAEIASLGAILQSFVASIHKQADVHPDAAMRREFLSRLGAENGLIERIAELQVYAIDFTLPAAKVDLLMLDRHLNDVLKCAKKLQKTSNFKALLYAKRNAETLQDMSAQLSKARQDFAMKGQFTIELILHKIVDDIAANQRALAEERAKAELEKELGRLPFAEAGFRASVHARHGGLLPGTRVELLRDLDEWAGVSSTSSKRDPMPFFVLSGSAGTGKSTIAFEVAKRAQDAGVLGATFFFMRGAQELSTTELVFPTLARQLISHVPALQPAAPRIIREHLRHGQRQNLEEQANELFTALLSTLPADHPPVVIVIDALDECTEAAQDLVPRMLFRMMEALPSIACPLRIFVSSRPELHIEDAFQSVTFTSKSQRFRLHEVPRPTIDADIKFYFENALRQLPETSRQVLSVLYPAVEEELTDLAAGLFIFAMTAMEYLKRFRHADIATAMETLMAPLRRGAPASRGSFVRLDNLYTVVLSTAFPDDFLSLPRRPEHVKAILGCLAVLQDHVSPRTLSALVSMDLSSELLPVLEPLAAVVMFSAQSLDTPIRPVHASFAEFLVDPARCADARFHVEPAKQHGVFAEHCFRLLARPSVLSRNPCRLPDPAVLLADVPDRHVRIAVALPLQVQYACTYWPAHVALGTFNLHLLSEFCGSRLLFWLEALSLLDRLNVVVTWFPVITSSRVPEWTPEYETSVMDMLHDAYRLTVECAPALISCPEQLYRSAVPLCPSSSRLRRTYGDVLREPHALRLVAGNVLNWPTWLRMLPTPSSGAKIDGVSRVLYAPHGRWVALCTSFGVIHLCSPDDGAIIKSIRVYPDPRPLQAILISANSLRILALDMRGEVRIVSTRSGAVLQSLPYFNIGVQDLQPRGIAWGPGDREVLILRPTDLLVWDPVKATTDILGSLPDSSMVRFTALTSSSDGRWAALLSGDQDLQVIEVSTRTRVFHTDISPTSAICFVPKSSIVVYGDSNGLVFYDVMSNQFTRQLPIHSAGRRLSPRISRDGSVIAYNHHSDRDRDLRAEVIFAEDGNPTPSKLGPCMTFDMSPDGRQLLVVVPGSLEWKMYDISHPERLREGTHAIVHPHADILALALPPDARFLGVLAYRNINILDTSTGEVVYELPFGMLGEERFDDSSMYARNWGVMLFPSSPEPLSLLRDPSAAPPPDYLDGPLFFSLTYFKDSLAIIVSYGALLQFHTVSLGTGPPGPESFRVLSSSIAALPDFIIDTDEPSILAAALSPDGSTLVADVIWSNRRNIFVWDAATLALRRSCAFRLVVDDIRVQPIRRIFISADMRIHLDGTSIVEPNEEGYTPGTFLLALSDVLTQDDVVLTRTPGMPDERFAWSKDGWISHGASARKLLWLPPSRWPEDEFEDITSTTSVRCGNIVATVSVDNLLSIIDMSAYEY